MLLAVGIFLGAVGVGLLFDLGGSARFFIRTLTSRSLGELAPGYAASRGGFRVYAALILFIGLTAAGLAIAPGAPLRGALGIAVGIVGFLVASAAALVGEVRTYRALPKDG
jgi:hypothetical protein